MHARHACAGRLRPFCREPVVLSLAARGFLGRMKSPEVVPGHAIDLFVRIGFPCEP